MAKDVFHLHVKAALENAGWKITHDPVLRTRALLNALERFGVRLLIFDPETKTIVEWKKF